MWHAVAVQFLRGPAEALPSLLQNDIDSHDMTKAKTPTLPAPLIGQWIGNFRATQSAGDIVIDLEMRSDHTVGSAMLFPGEGSNGPVMVGRIDEIYLGADGAFATIVLQPTHPKNPTYLVPPHQVQEVFPPEIRIATKAQARIRWDGTNMVVEWNSDIGMEGSARLIRNDPDRPSDIPSKRMSWDAFKRHVSCLETRKFIFRGQQKPWRLRSHFHRTNRSDLFRYTFDDLATLHRHLSARTKHIFNRADSDQLGALLHLAQHHGFPTPLIDWTYSPYVAAFFAFRHITIATSRKPNAGYIRIFRFDQAKWREDTPQIPITAPVRPHFSLMEFLAIENERLIPQQALSALTNVDDVESYIKAVEQTRQHQYVYAIDIPVKERETVMKELALMGITAGSLFPGLDGACEELRERLFAQ